MLQLTAEERFERYMNNIKKAQKKYCEANRDKLNAFHRNYYHEKLANNEEYREMKRKHALEYYYKKKQEKLNKQQQQPISS